MDLSAFIVYFMGAKLTEFLGDSISISIQIRENGEPQGELSIRPGAIQCTTDSIINLANEYATNGVRSHECSN